MACYSDDSGETLLSEIEDIYSEEDSNDIIKLEEGDAQNATKPRPHPKEAGPSAFKVVPISTVRPKPSPDEAGHNAIRAIPIRMFFLKYFSQFVRDEKEAEFLMIKQVANQSFDEYLARYIKLSKYSTYLQYMNDECWSTKKVTRGLKPELREKVAPRQLEVFNKTVEVCHITENSQNHQDSIRATQRAERPAERSSQEGTSSSHSRKQKRPDLSGRLKRGGKARREGMDPICQGGECEICAKTIRISHA
ncbi:uncharacterized protein LOC114757411 [Neltuma alba]|uniref:uncharacterized protein LOC114757411 n=1 Tax=Neltuma alba TaxID=207710 RepID=UPI0010A3EFC1|nr:uncharacterized protein LOC114757411 [Prosopis alba]